MIARTDGNKKKRTEETQTGFRGGAAAAVPVCPYVVFPAVGRGESGVRGLQRRESGQRGRLVSIWVVIGYLVKETRLFGVPGARPARLRRNRASVCRLGPDERRRVRRRGTRDVSHGRDLALVFITSVISV